MKFLSILALCFFATATAFAQTSTPAPEKSIEAPRTYLPNMKKLKKKKSSVTEKPAVEKNPAKCTNEEGKSIIPGDADYDSKCSGAGASTM